MNRSLTMCFGAGVVLVAAAVSWADEVFPVVHNEPIAVRVVDGKDGRPVAHAHVLLVAGYDLRDLRLGIWREEALTDGEGMARLSSGLKNLPWLQVRVAKRHLCEGDADGAAFSVEQIRRDGLSAANRCGTATDENAAGVVTVFVKGKKADRKAAAPDEGADLVSGPCAVSSPAPDSAPFVAAARAPVNVPAAEPGGVPDPAPALAPSAPPAAAPAAAPAPAHKPDAEPAPTDAPAEIGIDPLCLPPSA